MQTSSYKITLVQSGLVISDANTTMVSQDPNQLVYSTVGKSKARSKTSLISIMIFFSALIATIMAEFNGLVNSDVTLLSVVSDTTVDPAECGNIHKFTPPTYHKDGTSEILIFKTDDDALSYAESLYVNTSTTINLPLFVEESNMLITDIEITRLPITHVAMRLWGLTLLKNKMLDTGLGGVLGLSRPHAFISEKAMEGK